MTPKRKAQITTSTMVYLVLALIVIAGLGYLWMQGPQSRVVDWSQLTEDYDNDGKIGFGGQDPCPCTVTNKIINYKGKGYCISEQDSEAFDELRSHYEDSTPKNQELLESGLLTPDDYGQDDTSIDRDIILYDPDLCAAAIVDDEIDWPNR